MKKALLSVACLIFLQGAYCQLRWIKKDSLYGPLPSSVHVFSASDSLSGKPFLAYYASVKLKDKNIRFTAQTGQGNRYTPTQYYKTGQLPVIVVNCSFFSFETNQNLNLVVADGKLQSYNVTALKGTGEDSGAYYYPTRGAIGIDRKRRADVAWTFTDSLRIWAYAFEDAPVIAKGKTNNPGILALNNINWKWWKMQTAVGGGPVLIHNGEIEITNREEQMFPGGENDKHPRTAMGYTRDGRLIILVIQGRFPGVAEGATLFEEAEILKTLGCYEALNFDGGGSSCMLINGKETIQPSDKTGQRAVTAVFMVKASRANKK